MKKNHLDTDSMFQNLISTIDNKSTEKSTRGRKAEPEKKIQVSIYLTESQARNLRLQSAEKVKENDKSAIARMGIDIALDLTDDDYLYIKNESKKQNIKPSDIINKALELYRKEYIFSTMNLKCYKFIVL